MKQLVFAAATILAFGAQHANAQCAAPFLTGSQIQTVLAGNTVCVGHTPTAEWSEWHNGSATGTVVDWKKGANDPIDPTKTVGTYTIKSSPTAGQVVYTYTGGSSYTFYVKGTANPYMFCSGVGATPITATVNAGQGPC